MNNVQLRIQVRTYRPTISAAPSAATVGSLFTAHRSQSEDPMVDKYPSFSPYTYCANNPVKLVDPDGEEVVGTDNKAVTYSYDSEGNVVWSNNASEDTKRIGNAMLQTETGKKQFNMLVQSDTRVTLKIDPQRKVNGNSLTFGSMRPTKFKLNSDGTINLQEATITIYEGTIEAYLNDMDFPFNVLHNNSAEGLSTLMSVPLVDQYMCAVACHEAEHIMPDNLKLNAKSSKSGIDDPNIENSPNYQKERYLWDLILLKHKLQ